MIVVVDYDAGNIRSVTKAIEKFGGSTKVSSRPEDVLAADKVVLPGVGAFGQAMEALKQRDLPDALIATIESDKPFLGICLGMHLLFESSEENSEAVGLSVLKGTVKRLPRGIKVPHLGWNQMKQQDASPLWKDVQDGAFYYFAHSFYIDPEDRSIISGQTEYDLEFASAIHRDSLFGLQFHPEKSQKWGLKILENFVNL